MRGPACLARKHKVLILDDLSELRAFLRCNWRVKRPAATSALLHVFWKRRDPELPDLAADGRVDRPPVVVAQRQRARNDRPRGI